MHLPMACIQDKSGKDYSWEAGLLGSAGPAGPEVGFFPSSAAIFQGFPDLSAVSEGLAVLGAADTLGTPLLFWSFRRSCRRFRLWSSCLLSEDVPGLRGTDAPLL